MSVRLIRGNTVMVFISIAFHVQYSSSPALFSSYQKENTAWDEVSVYTVNLTLDLSFLITSIQYDASCFYGHHYFDEGAFFTLKKKNSENFLYYFFNYYLPSPRPTLGHCRGESLTNAMLITAFDAYSIRPDGHREPSNKVG